MTFPCPHCGERLTAPDERAGKALVCPLCGKSTLVPGQPREAPAEPNEPGAPSPGSPSPAVSFGDARRQAALTVSRRTAREQRPMTSKEKWLLAVALVALAACLLIEFITNARYGGPSGDDRRASAEQFDQARQRADLQRQVDQCLPYAQQVIGELGGTIDANLSQSGQSVVVEVRVPMVMDEPHALEVAYGARKYFHAVSADTLVTVRVHSPAGQTLAEKSFYPWTPLN